MYSLLKTGRGQLRFKGKVDMSLSSEVPRAFAPAQPSVHELSGYQVVTHTWAPTPGAPELGLDDFYEAVNEIGEYDR